MALAICLLGPFEIRDGESSGKSLEWSRKQTQSLLKILLTERGRVFTDDQLIEYLIPEIDFDKGIANLKKRVSELRKTLEPDRNGNC